MRRFSSTTTDVAALRELVRQSAAEPAPPIDWDKVEHDLFVQIDTTLPGCVNLVEAPARSKVASPWSSWRSLMSVAVAAAVAAAFVAGTDRPLPVLRDRKESAARTIAPQGRNGDALLFDGASLAVGDVVEASSAPVVYEHDGRVTWTLSPGSSVRAVALGSEGSARSSVPAAGPSITLDLVRGSVHAEVVHRDREEAFAIEVGKTRIAVHGTSFTVTREGDRAMVEVTHGSVAVGPAGHPGSTQGWLLVGPERASFSLDGGQDVRWFGAPNAPVPAAPGAHPMVTVSGGEPRPSTSRMTPVAPSSPSAPSGPLPVELSEAAYGPATARIVASIAACHQHQVASGGVDFSVASSLTLSIAPDGSIPEAVFSPPLSPILMACAEEQIRKARFPRAAGPTRVRVPVELTVSP